MKVSVVLTTINKRESTSISELEKKCEELGWDLIVIGDKKTPEMWLEYGEYYSPEAQLASGFKLAEELPWNCYARKNIGYLIAYHSGADYIISTDDDNYPLDNYGGLIDLFDQTSGDYIPGGTDQFVNYLEYFNNTDQKIWPRGLPLEAVNNTLTQTTSRFTKKVGVVSGLWNGSPDFDAIGHTYYGNQEWEFKKDRTLFKESGWAPYNTQNTVFSREVLPFQFLPVGIGRADDIWTSYIAQAVLDRLGLGVMYSSPTVCQHRNTHDYLKDLVDEKKVFLETHDLIQAIKKVTGYDRYSYYMNLSRAADKFIPSDHKRYVELWLKDLEVIQ